MALKNDQYNAIMRQYDLHRQEAIKLAQDREQAIMERLPEYADLDAQISSTAAEHVRLRVQGLPTQDLHERIQALEAQKALVLKCAGISPDVIKPVYHCPDCEDTGYIGDEKCHCFKQAIVDLVYAQSNIREQLASENFQNFDFKWYSEETDPRLGISPRDNMKRVVESCVNFIKHFDQCGGNILFYGNTGVGKTFLSHCIAKELLDSAHTVIYMTAQNLMDMLAAHAFNKEMDPDMPEDMRSYIQECDLLIIDDLGTELANNFTVSQLFSCLNERLQNHKSTIISTNLSLDDLQEVYSERIFSRLVSNYQVALILGDDIRIRKAIS